MWIKHAVDFIGSITGNPITTALVVMLSVVIILGVLEKFIWGSNHEE